MGLISLDDLFVPALYPSTGGSRTLPVTWVMMPRTWMPNSLAYGSSLNPSLRLLRFSMILFWRCSGGMAVNLIKDFKCF